MTAVSVHTISSVFLSVFLSLTLGSCSQSGSTQQDADRNSAIAVSEASYPGSAEAIRGIIQLEQHMNSGDAREFAADCSYPIERPYPLRDIADSAEMEIYFPLLIDDSIKAAVRNAQFERWHPRGWRGWTLDDGRYLWWDGKVYAVNYLSNAEKAIRRKLIDEELKSLHASLRNGWQPFFCLIGTENGTIYRIDVSDNFTTLSEYTPDVPVRFRMLVYPRTTELWAIPDESYQGSMHAEGSAGNRILRFVNGNGASAQFNMDQPDGSNPDITIIASDDTVSIPVGHIYWRDYSALPR